MKTHSKYLKLIAQLLVVAVLLQSCKIYHSTSESTEYAVNTNKGVKIYLDDNKPYRFEEITSIDNSIVGTTRYNSFTHHRLQKQGFSFEREGRMSLISIPVEKVLRIHCIDSFLTASTAILASAAVIIIFGSLLAQNAGIGGVGI